MPETIKKKTLLSRFRALEQHRTKSADYDLEWICWHVALMRSSKTPIGKKGACTAIRKYLDIFSRNSPRWCNWVIICLHIVKLALKL